MRRITLEKVMDSSGVHLIAVKKCPLFDQGDIIELRTPDDTYHVIFDAAKKSRACAGCLFEDIQKRGIWSCPTFKDGSLICSHTQDRDTRFIPLDSVLEDL